MKLRWVSALLVAVAGLALYAGNVLATTPPVVTSTILAKSLFQPMQVFGNVPSIPWRVRLRTHGLSDVYVVDNKLDPGSDTGWHSHPGPSLIMVVAGTVTNYMGDDPSCTPHVYTAGMGFVDPGGGDVHILRNETSAQAETIAVQLLPKDAPRKIDVTPAPGNCPF